MSKLSELNTVILNCAEYNKKKLKAYWLPAKSSAEKRREKLEFGICLSVMVLVCAEKFHWNLPNSEPSPGGLIRRLLKLINNTQMEMTTEEHVSKLEDGIGNAISYLEKIKDSMKSKTLQEVEKYLNGLLEVEN